MINKVFISLMMALLLQSLSGCGGGGESSGATAPETTAYQLSYPQGRLKALILSFDDGLEQDRRLVELFNRYGLRGTFNLNSGLLGTTAYWREPRESYVTRSEIATLYQGHEVASHTVYHPNLTGLTPADVEAAVADDQQALSQLVGAPITSLAYPFGTTNDDVIEQLSQLNISNARTVANSQNFSLPSEPLRWAPTCHYRDLNRFADNYLTLNEQQLSVFYIWGHSWELDDGNDWDLMEEFGSSIGYDDAIWFTTTGELTAYRQALARVEENENILYNPATNPTVWVIINGEVESLEPGASMPLPVQ